jgi:DNA-binding response OmpR family regulator
MINKYKLLKDKTVLYVEDDLNLQKNVEEILGHFFERLFIASNGDEAVDIFIENQNKIDIIITDINMPYTDGITFSKYVREYNKGLPIIIMSAYTDTDYLLDSIDLNIIKYITKPFTSKKVTEMLDKLLEFFQLNNKVIIKNNIELDIERRELLVDNKVSKLSKKETIFLKLLSENALVSYEMMHEYMWDYDTPPSEDAIKSFMRKLKKKLPQNLCQNQHGMGYFLNKE